MEILHRRALPHVEEDLPEVLSHLEQGMQSTSVRRVAESSQVVFLELSLLPCASVFTVSVSQRQLRLVYQSKTKLTRLAFQ